VRRSTCIRAEDQGCRQPVEGAKGNTVQYVSHWNVPNVSHSADFRPGRLMSLLHLRNRLQAVAYALRAGIL
jgi:hypothetical protein